MVRVPEIYFINDDVRAFRRRIEWLDKKLAERDVNAGGASYDRCERKALKRLLSQVDEKAQPCDPPGNRSEPDFSRLRQAGWSVKYLGGSQPKPWAAAKEFRLPEDYSHIDNLVVESIEAASFGELEALAAARDAQ